jgi:hypothetical protein
MDRMSAAAVLLLSTSTWAQAAPDGGTTDARPIGDSGGASAAPSKPPLDLSLMPFTNDSVKKVIAYHHDEIQACYEETLASKDKPVEGRVMTSFVVTPEGTVKNARVLKKGTTLKDPKLHDCLVDALGTFAFPKPSDRRDHPIEFPFNLKAVR